MKRERSGGGSKMDIAYLLLCALMVSVHSLDVEIGISVDKTKGTSHSHEHLDFKYREHPELNPCENKKCDEGEKCHVVRNPVMLQLPIALCEKEVLVEDAGTDDGCPKFPLVSKIFQCKTEIEWEGLARKQCQIRLAATVETVITSVRYPCRFGRRSSGVRVFQQVEVSCCKLSSGTLQPTAADGVVTSVSPTKEAMTTQGDTAPTSWDEWGETSDRDYADFSGNVPAEDPPRNHHHLMWFIFPSVAIATLCSMACLTFCLVRACMVRRRLRRAYKRFPPDPPQRVLANGSYNDTEEEDELYSKPNTGVGGYEPAVKPNLIFRNDSTEDMLAYDMFIAGKRQ